MPVSFIAHHSALNVSYDPRGIADDYGARGNIFSDDRAGSDGGALADLDAAEDSCIAPDACAATDDGAL